MPWLLTSPGHQQPWYWLCKICRSWSYLRMDFKYICVISMWSNDIKCEYISLTNLACKGLSFNCCDLCDTCLHSLVIVPVILECDDDDSLFEDSRETYQAGLLNSLWPNDAIWRHRSRSTLAQVMACCLTTPSHYLNQCWLIMSEVQWHSYLGNFTRDAWSTNHEK